MNKTETSKTTKDQKAEPKRRSMGLANYLKGTETRAR